MSPFLMTLTSGYDHWMYVSSTGCLTAGRSEAKYSIFPYVTDDLLHKNAHFTGPITLIEYEKNNKKNDKKNGGMISKKNSDKNNKEHSKNKSKKNSNKNNKKNMKNMMNNNKKNIMNTNNINIEQQY